MPLREQRIALYQSKAHDCAEAAAAATDPNARLQLLELANRWSILVFRLQQGHIDIDITD